jgi:pSer/pThr/pTyr-binding forkhead associated (FHA) protein
MPASFSLAVQGEGIPTHAVSIGKRPFSIGRGPGNDLVVPDGMVSWEHIKIWADRGEVWCSDAGSTNGTFVNGEQMHGTVQLNVGDTITIGDKLELKVQLLGTQTEQTNARSVALENVTTGLMHHFRSTRFIIGSAPDADLGIPGAPPYAVEFAIHGPDDIWMMVDTDDRQLEIGQEFEVAGLKFRLVEVTDVPMSKTIQPQKDRFPYKLVATLDGPTGPMAELENLQNGHRCRIDAETRAILLFLLGRRFDEDRKTDTPREEMGWLSDDDVIVGVWGRSGLPDGANRLKVLVHRLRAEAKRGGFDPWFIERRRRFIRVRIRDFQPSASPAS